MSFTSSYNTVDIAADSPKIRAALTQVLESKGWKLIDNELLKEQGKDQVGVRAHGAEAGRSTHSYSKILEKNILHTTLVAVRMRKVTLS